MKYHIFLHITNFVFGTWPTSYICPDNLWNSAWIIVIWGLPWSSTTNVCTPQSLQSRGILADSSHPFLSLLFNICTQIPLVSSIYFFYSSTWSVVFPGSNSRKCFMIHSPISTSPWTLQTPTKAIQTAILGSQDIVLIRSSASLTGQSTQWCQPCRCSVPGSQNSSNTFCPCPHFTCPNIISPRDHIA